MSNNITHTFFTTPFISSTTVQSNYPFVHPTPFTGYAKKGSVYSAISLSARSLCLCCHRICWRLSALYAFRFRFLSFAVCCLSSRWRPRTTHVPPTPSEPRPRSTLGPTLGFGFHSSFSLEIFHIKNNKKSCMLMFRLVYCRIEKKLKNNFCIWHFSMEANFASRKRERTRVSERENRISRLKSNT